MLVLDVSVVIVGLIVPRKAWVSYDAGIWAESSKLSARAEKLMG